jgi:hypothetical protein
VSAAARTSRRVEIFIEGYCGTSADRARSPVEFQVEFRMPLNGAIIRRLISDF